MILLTFLQFQSTAILQSSLRILEESTNYTYNCIAVSSEDNRSVLSGKPGQGGAALFWEKCLNDLVKPLEKSPLLASVYICPLQAIVSRNLLNTWALCDSLSIEGFVIIMGDLKGDLGNSLGDKSCYAPNDCGLRLLDFANYLNLCPINLLSICSGPLKTFVSQCGKFKLTIDYILLPNCLHDSIVSCKTVADLLHWQQ